MNLVTFLDRRCGVAALWGGVIALSMMRVWPSLFFTPIYLVALFALFDSLTRQTALRLARSLSLLTIYCVFAILSLTWAALPALSLRELRGDLLIPLLAGLASLHVARQRCAYKHQGEALLAGAWAGFLLGSGIAWLYFGSAWIGRLFDSVGYYTSYLFMLAGMSLPYLNRRRRWLFYPLLAGLLFLTQQRVAWVVFPVVGVADLLLAYRGRISPARMLLAILVVLVFSYGMMKLVAEKKPVDSLNPEVQASGLFERLAKNERLRPWREWFARGFERPVVGHGFGRDNVKAHFTGDGEWPERNLHHGHNVLLNTFLQLGGVGVILFIAAHGQLILFLIQRKRQLAYGGALLILFFFLRNMFDDFSFQRLLVVYALFLGWSLAAADAARYE